jgi:hypothetical protein
MGWAASVLLAHTGEIREDTIAMIATKEQARRILNQEYNRERI